MNYSEAHGRSAALTCRRFGISRQARDVVWRWDVVEVRRQATAAVATSFLEVVMERMSFVTKLLDENQGLDKRGLMCYGFLIFVRAVGFSFGGKGLRRQTV